MADQQKFFRGQSVRVGDTPITSRKGEFDGVVVCKIKPTRHRIPRSTKICIGHGLLWYKLSLFVLFEVFS